ncbi:HAD family hydrolase [Enterococcus sp. JM9B]|uniref:HAD family hydrolase n=1 Tax=Enterococcus sp. JM9B TaxID=1857216 RepID=UPI001374C93F|nr:HAD family phosphatase [Enterococcus sp. JM9B]KAF1303914.1 HAD family hydrolase [Enterococcus sp. JM9B]
MNRLAGVIFDMDGLIFDTEMIYYEATQIVADELKIPYDKALYLRFLGVSDEEVWEGYHRLFDETFGTEYVQQFIEQSYRKTLEMFEAGQASLKPGVRELLRALDDAGLPRVVASSNQREVIDRLLAVSNLSHEFMEIISFEDVVRAKPDPEIFEVAQQRLQLPKERLVILEDSQNGILAAYAAGIPVIMVPDLLLPDEELKQKTVAVLDSLVEVPSFLQRFYN